MNGCVRISVQKQQTKMTKIEQNEQNCCYKTKTNKNEHK